MAHFQPLVFQGLGGTHSAPLLFDQPLGNKVLSVVRQPPKGLSIDIPAALHSEIHGFGICFPLKWVQSLFFLMGQLID